MKRARIFLKSTMWKFKRFGSAIAAEADNGEVITYNQLDELVSDLQTIAGRTLVFNLCTNSIGSFAGYAAMINAHIVPAMIADDLDKELLNSLIEEYCPEFIWMPSAEKASYAKCEEVFSAYNYSLLKTNFEKYKISDELALLLTTSGSTGSFKLVRQSYRNIEANTESIVEYLSLDSTERPITTLPMNYTYGLSIINTHLWVGAKVLITDKTLAQREFWNFFKTKEATSFGGVPYTYEILKKLRFFRMDLPSLRYMTQAGGKLTIELHKEFAEDSVAKGRKFIVMYGQTEATARMAYLPAEKALEKCGSMGVAIPGGHFELIDVKGEVITEPDIVGELVYYGDNVTLGYAEHSDDLAKGDERCGKLVTGDMAKMDADGYYYIVGRKKRFLKMFGKRVNLDEIDRLMKMHFDNIDCASDGVDDSMYLFLTDKALLDEARKYIAGKININLSAIHSIFVESIPKNNSGKTLYSELKKLF